MAERGAGRSGPEGRVRRGGMMWRGAAALAGAVLTAAPGMAALAQDCAPLSRNFVFCDAGTDWAAAQWEQFGDGATIVLGDLRLDFGEDWIGRDDAQEAAAALDGVLEETLADIPHQSVSRDGFDAGRLAVTREILTVAADDEPQTLRAAMIAEGAGRRIFLRLDAPVGLPVPEIDRRSREIAGLVRLAQEG